MFVRAECLRDKWLSHQSAESSTGERKPLTDGLPSSPSTHYERDDSFAFPSRMAPRERFLLETQKMSLSEMEREKNKINHLWKRARRQVPVFFDPIATS